jgi:hypothetical protein
LKSDLLVDLVVVVVVDMDFDGDGNGNVAAPTLTLRFRTSRSTLRRPFQQIDPPSVTHMANELAHAKGVGGCVVMIAVQSSTLAGHVAVAVAVKVHDDDHD